MRLFEKWEMGYIAKNYIKSSHKKEKISKKTADYKKSRHLYKKIHYLYPSKIKNEGYKR